MMHRYDLVIYHRDCADGFTAAWLAHKHLGDTAEYIPAGYNDTELPDVTDKHVLILDFSYPNETLKNLVTLGGAKTVTIIDHHKTAQKDLEEFMVGGPEQVKLDDPQYFADSIQLIGGDEAWPIRAWFDMERSGAGLMFSYLRYLNPFLDYSEEADLVQYVQARDLWQLDSFRGIREFHAGLMSYPFSFHVWTHASFNTGNIIEEGTSILRAHDKTIEQLLPITERTMSIGGIPIPVANMPYTMASDAAHIMASAPAIPFAATYYDNKDGKRVFSLRSSKEHGIDVSGIAKLYGGGGHKHAAGFTAPSGWEGGDWDHPNNWAPDVED